MTVSLVLQLLLQPMASRQLHTLQATATYCLCITSTAAIGFVGGSNVAAATSRDIVGAFVMLVNVVFLTIALLLSGFYGSARIMARARQFWNGLYSITITFGAFVATRCMHITPSAASQQNMEKRCADDTNLGESVKA